MRAHVGQRGVLELERNRELDVELGCRVSTSVAGQSRSLSSSSAEGGITTGGQLVQIEGGRTLAAVHQVRSSSAVVAAALLDLEDRSRVGAVLASERARGGPRKGMAPEASLERGGVQVTSPRTDRVLLERHRHRAHGRRRRRGRLEVLLLVVGGEGVVLVVALRPSASCARTRNIPSCRR